jgi:DNA-binding FadR family transcriptional regulator
MVKPLRGPALTEAIRDYIKQYILEHELRVGDSLPPETQLAQDLGVGRSSVREAIKALQSLGIVEVRHGNGLYVREHNFDPILEMLDYSMRFDPRHVAELSQIRIWLEAAVVEDAVKRVGAAELAELAEVLQAWSKRAEAGQSCSDLDAQFHRILYKTLDNLTLIKLFDVFWIAFENLDFEQLETCDPLEEFKSHYAIFEAVKAGQTALTRQRLIQHFAPLKRRIEQAIAFAKSQELI